MTEAEFDQCIDRICHGDKSGLKDIYVEYLPYLYRTVYSIVQNKEDAEDVTSEFFVKLWSLAPKYEPGNGHKGYLATIARNMAIDFVRKHRREIPVETPEEYIRGGQSPGATIEGGSADAGEKAGTAEEGRRRTVCMPAEAPPDTPEMHVVEKLSVKEAMDRLKPEERRIVDMKILGEMTFKEISELLHIPIGTVTWRYQEGIKRLRRYGYE